MKEVLLPGEHQLESRMVHWNAAPHTTGGDFTYVLFIEDTFQYTMACQPTSSP